jgi:hypothetical protein
MSPHDLGACQDLENQLLWLRKQAGADPLVLLVTGDLTVSGDASEFALAQSYLRGRLQTVWASSLGLGKVANSVITIPGNHDHLGGRLARTLVRRHPVSPAYAFFPPTQSRNHAWWQLHEILSDDLIVQIGTLDSCGAQTPQFGARGSIDQHAIQELEQAMHSRRSDNLHAAVVRILMIHHSLSPHPNAMVAATHALDQRSQQLVQDYCNKTLTQFVLTGHEHCPLMPKVGPPPFGTEIRCGSSLQDGNHSGNGQIFLLHTVNGGANPRWQTVAYQRLGQRPYVPATQITYSTRL